MTLKKWLRMYLVSQKTLAAPKYKSEIILEELEIKISVQIKRGKKFRPATFEGKEKILQKSNDIRIEIITFGG